MISTLYSAWKKFAVNVWHEVLCKLYILISCLCANVQRFVYYIYCSTDTFYSYYSYSL